MTKWRNGAQDKSQSYMILPSKKIIERINKRFQQTRILLQLVLARLQYLLYTTKFTLYLFDIDIQRHPVSLQSTDMFAKYRDYNSPRSGFRFDTSFHVSRRSFAKNDLFITKNRKT